MLVTYYWLKMTGNLSWKDGGKLNTVMVNVCIKTGITIQLVNLPCNTIFQYIESVQIEWTCMTSYQEVYWKLLWCYAVNRMKPCEDLMLSPPQDLMTFLAVSTLSGSPSRKSSSMYLFCNTQPKKNLWFCLLASLKIKHNGSFKGVSPFF